MQKVFVSGGTGYIALHCISRLIKKGFTVKTSLRDMNRKSEVIHSISKVVNCNDKIEFCKLDGANMFYRFNFNGYLILV